MIRKQAIAGNNQKEYALISNFNKGFDSNTTDGVIDPSTFRDMLNFEMKEEGIVTKRPGSPNIGMDSLLKVLYFGNGTTLWSEAKTENSPAKAITANFKGTSFIDGTNGSEKYNPYRQLIKLEDDIMEDPELGVLSLYRYQKILYFWLDDTLADHLGKFRECFTVVDGSIVVDYEKLYDIYNTENIQGDIYSEESTQIKNRMSFKAIVAGVGNRHNDGGLGLSKATTFKYISGELGFTRGLINFDPETNSADGWSLDFYTTLKRFGNELSIDELADKSYNLDREIFDREYLNVISYSDNQYFTTGYGLYKINSNNDLIKVNGINAYKPTAMEITNVGFNIMADSTLTWYENTGTAPTIRGIFYTLDGEPIQKIPNNKSFKIHVINTGTGALVAPKYRPDNGDTDVATNPYKTMAGSYGSGAEAHIFTVTEFNLDGKFEIKIEKTSTPAIEPFIGYFETGTQIIPDNAKLNTVSLAINSSKYCAIINNQLVLFGGHGYIFFSEYSNFAYFPNYYNLYAIDRTGDEVTTIKYFRQFYAVGTKEKWKRMSGSFGAEDFGLFPLNDFVGCTNPESVRQIQNNLIFVYNDGLYKLKQGYTGEGTENIELVDFKIKDKYDYELSTRAVVRNNDYILGIKDDILLYNYIMDAFVPYNLRKTGTDTFFSALFDKDITGRDYYICKIINANSTYDEDNKEVHILSFVSDRETSADDGLPYRTAGKLTKIFLDTPTHDKKFKKSVFNIINNGDGAIPLYVSAWVDDILILSPVNYYLRIDEDTNYIYYEKQINPNDDIILKSSIGIDSGSVIGEIILGETRLGETRNATVLIGINQKGKGISVEIADNYYDEEGELVGTNTKPFSISDIGFTYKVKKVKAR